MIDYENARRKAKRAAKQHLKLNPMGATIGSAVDIAISVYNAEIGEATEQPDPPSLDEMAETPRPAKTEADIAALAERLAKVEDRLAGPHPADNSLLTRIDRLDEMMKRRRHDIDDVNRRIDGVAEIFGNRVAELGDEIGSALDSAKRAHERVEVIERGDAQDYDYVLKGLDEVRLRAGLGTMQAEHPRAAFPTGGASTAEAAAEAVLPVPVRGDRVRLEGASGEVSGRRIKDGWYDVIGWSAKQIQIRVTTDGNGNAAPDWLPWLATSNPAIKEVRHAQ